MQMTLHRLSIGHESISDLLAKHFRGAREKYHKARGVKGGSAVSIACSRRGGGGTGGRVPLKSVNAFPMAKAIAPFKVTQLAQGKVYGRQAKSMTRARRSRGKLPPRPLSPVLSPRGGGWGPRTAAVALLDCIMLSHWICIMP